MTNYREQLRDLFSSIEYTDRYNTKQRINVYYEEEITEGKARFKTPAVIIRGIRVLITPLDIGWNLYTELYDIDVTLYLKQRSSNYTAGTVREEISNTIKDLVKQNKGGFIIGDLYLKLVDIRDRDYLEEVGILRRDYSLELYKEV